MNFRMLSAGISTLLFVIFMPEQASAAGNVNVTSHVENHATEGWTISCPAGAGHPAILIDVDTLFDSMTVAEMEHFAEVVSQFESENGVSISSRTTTDDDGNVTSDVIHSSSNGPNTGPGAELCDIVRRHAGGGTSSSTDSSGTGSSGSGDAAATTSGRTPGGATRDGSTRTRPGREPDESAGSSNSSSQNSASQSSAGGSVTVTTHVENHATEGWTISCPAGDGYPAIMIDVDRLFDSMTVAEMVHFADVVSQFERENGVSLSSRTETDDDGNVTSDVIHSSSTGPASGAGAGLCDIVRRHAGGGTNSSDASRTASGDSSSGSGAATSSDPGQGISRAGNRNRPQREPNEGRSVAGGATHTDTWQGERSAQGSGADDVTITSLSEDAVYVGGTINCPEIGRNPAFVADLENVLGQMNERQGTRLTELIRNFEARNGVQTASGSSGGGDQVRTESSGSITGSGRQICNLIRSYAS